MSESSSDVNSFVKTVVETGKEHIGAIFGAAKFTVLKVNLAQAAAEKRVLEGGVKRKDVVVSPLIKYTLAAYRGAADGKIVVACTPSNTGKTHAAEFFMHGAHPFRADRSLKILAVTMKYFSQEFAGFTLGIPQVSRSLSRILCKNALTFKEPTIPSRTADLVARAGKVADQVLCTSPSGSVSPKDIASIAVYGREGL
jgi:hypothetical protein